MRLQHVWRFALAALCVCAFVAARNSQAEPPKTRSPAPFDIPVLPSVLKQRAHNAVQQGKSKRSHTEPVEITRTRAPSTTNAPKLAKSLRQRTQDGVQRGQPKRSRTESLETMRSSPAPASNSNVPNLKSLLKQRAYNNAGQHGNHRARHKPGCKIELTSLLKSGSTWTEIVIFALLETACANDSKCSIERSHMGAHNRTVGMDLLTDVERPAVAWEVCNASVHFNSARKHNLWGMSFYREGVEAGRSVFALLVKNCVNKHLTVTSAECLSAMYRVVPEPELLDVFENRWLNIACLRDPRAVAVSECHWMGRDINGTGDRRCSETKENFHTLVYATGFLYNYWKNVLKSRNHVVIYEKMLADPEAEYRALADFLGVGSLVSDGEIAAIVANTTAAALAKQEVEGTLLGKSKVIQFNAAERLKRASLLQGVRPACPARSVLGARSCEVNAAVWFVEWRGWGGAVSRRRKDHVPRNKKIALGSSTWTEPKFTAAQRKDSWRTFRRLS